MPLLHLKHPRILRKSAATRVARQGVPAHVCDYAVCPLSHGMATCMLQVVVTGGSLIRVPLALRELVFGFPNFLWKMPRDCTEVFGALLSRPALSPNFPPCIAGNRSDGIPETLGTCCPKLLGRPEACERLHAKSGEVSQRLADPQCNIHQNPPYIHQSSGKGPPHSPASPWSCLGYVGGLLNMPNLSRKIPVSFPSVQRGQWRNNKFTNELLQGGQGQAASAVAMHPGIPKQCLKRFLGLKVNPMTPRFKILTDMKIYSNCFHGSYRKRQEPLGLLPR